MAESNVHPETGADDDTKIWNDLIAAEAAKAEPAADAKPAPKQDAEKAADAPADDKDAKDKDTGKPASETVDDIWAKAPPELRAAHDATRTELERERTTSKRHAGTVSGLQRKVNELLKATPAPGAAKPEAKTAAPDPLDDEGWKKFETDYPELAETIGALRTRLHAAETKVNRLEPEVGTISSERRLQSVESAQLPTVLAAHPDYDRIAKSDEFLAWFDQAPAFIQDGVKRNAEWIVDGNEVVHIVKLFKAETGWAAKPANHAGAKEPAPQKPPATDKRSLQLDSAAAPRGGKGPAKVTSGPPDDADEAALWNYYADQERNKERARNR